MTTPPACPRRSLTAASLKMALTLEAKTALGYFDKLRKLLRHYQQIQQTAPVLLHTLSRTAAPDAAPALKTQFLNDQDDAAALMSTAYLAAQKDAWGDVSRTIEKARSIVTKSFQQEGRLFAPADVVACQATRQTATPAP